MGKWEEVKLSEIVQDFIVPKRDKPKVFSGNIPWCRIEDFNGVYLEKSKSNQNVSEETIGLMNLMVYPINTVIVSCSADLGRCAIIKKPLVTNQTFIGLVPKQDLNSKFLYYLMTYKAKKLNELASGTTIKYLSKKKFQNLDVFITKSLSEQKRIVAKLDGLFTKIDGTIGLLEENISHTQALMGSVLDEEFGRLETKFGKVDLMSLCDKITDGSHHSPKAIEKGIPYVTVRDVSWKGEIDTVNCKKISKSDFLELERNSCKPLIGDVLLSKDGTVGKVAIVDFDMDWVVLSSLAIIRPNNSKLDTSYLSWMLKTPKIQELAIGLKTGAAIKRIVLRTIKAIEIPTPKTLKEQEKVSQYFDDLNKPYQKLIKTQTQKLNHLKALKSSLLDQAFKGEL